MTEQPRPAWAARLQAERETRKWGTWETARRLYAAAGIAGGNIRNLARQITRHETGAVFPTEWAPHYATAYGFDERELFGDALPTWPAPPRLSALATAGTVPSPGRRVIQVLEVMGQDRLSAVADGLMELVDHYALTISAAPPAEVYDELVTVKAYASRVLDKTGAAPLRRDLASAAGWLSSLLAVAACDMGEHAAARLWCSDAEHRSEEADLPELAGWALLTRSMIAMYQGQPRQSVAHAAMGQQVTPKRTIIRAKLASQEMRAAAMLGDRDRTASARLLAAQSIADLPPEAAEVNGAFSIALAEDPPYTATALMLLAHHKEAVQATRRVIATVYQPEARKRGEHPSGYARSLLILALAHAGVGELDGALSAAHEALSGDRPAWPTIVLAGKLDRALANTFRGSGQVEEYHSRYLESADPLGIPQLPGSRRNGE